MSSVANPFKTCFTDINERKCHKSFTMNEIVLQIAEFYARLVIFRGNFTLMFIYIYIMI